ncbi:putative vacuolar protein sorting-associated protein [Rhypophila decipiens]
MTEVSPNAGDNGATDATSDTSSHDTTEPLQPPREQASTGDGVEEGTERGEQSTTDNGDEGEEDDNDEEDEDSDEDEDDDDEPKLKYARLTSQLGAVYRNGDATSTFLVAGDKMIVGTHNGNIHVLQLPSMQSLRVYHAHSASVTGISISPFPPPLPSFKAETAAKHLAQSANSPLRPGTGTSDRHVPAAASSRRPREPPGVPNTPSNNIHIATSSMDGNICVQSLVDIKDVQLRNFQRPIQAVALSPDYKNDRTYLSGGLAGQLVLTVGAPQGRSTATTTGAAAQAAGWLGSMVGASTGKDTVLHSGEGTINTIKWSSSGKYVAWMNEHGIWIMRTKLHLDSADVEDAWKPVGHVDRPLGEDWETMAGVWKGRAEWIDEQTVEADEQPTKDASEVVLSPAAEKLKQQQLKNEKKIERLLLGWGNFVWIVHVHPGRMGVGKNVGERSAGKAEVVNKLRLDCIISGISLYTQNLLLVLAYCLPEEEEDDDEPNAETVRGHKHSISAASGGSEPSGGIRRRQNNLLPELRLIDLTSHSEVAQDGLSVSRFERLTSGDYHLGVLPARNVAAATSTKGALEALAGLGTDMLNAALNPKSLFSSGASIMSKNSNDGASGSRIAPTFASSASTLRTGGRSNLPPSLAKPGMKIFIHSPYDCILATKRDLGDHLGWLLEKQQYQQAWELVDEHPEIMSTATHLSDLAPGSPTQSQSTDDFFDETASVLDAQRILSSSAEREKRRIGELWLDQLVQAEQWSQAGEIYPKVLSTTDRLEGWAWVFVKAKKFDEIVNALPTERTRPPMSGAIYETVLHHYLEENKPRFAALLERWTIDLFDANAIITALRDQLTYREVQEDSVQDGEVGRDWRIVMESLAKLYEQSGRNKDALRCFIALQDADSAMRLIKDGHLAEAVADDIPGFIGLRVPQDKLNKNMLSHDELERLTSEAITLLVDEAQHGLVKPEVVVRQLEENKLHLYTFFYLRGLWSGKGIHNHEGESHARLVSDSQTLVDGFADLAVDLFARFGRDLLMGFLKTSTAYGFEKAVQVCEQRDYIPEQVYLLSKTGQMKRALFLIIDRLGDVSRAIAFAKEQDDPDLWEDLLDYSMDKPRFIRGLLEEVGTAIDPIDLVRRIPEGLEIEGLREGLTHIMREHEIQYSISAGVAKVLRSEVADAQGLLRRGQRRGVKFEVVVKRGSHVDIEAKDPKPVQAQSTPGQEEGPGEVLVKRPAKKWSPGHCAQCYEPFVEWEGEPLVGFTCGHVFHLKHLLKRLYPDRKEDEEDDLLMGGGANHGHLIGAKVTHARLLKERIRGGCPVCVESREKEDGLRYY